MNKRILITLPYSFSYRNIVLTGVLKKLLSNGHSVLVLVPRSLLLDDFLNSLLIEYPDSLIIDQIERPGSLSIANFLFTISSSMMFSIQNTYSYRIKKAFFIRKDFKKFMKFIAPTFFLPKSKFLFKLLASFFFNLLRNSKVRLQIENYKPDVVFFTSSNKINEYFYIKYAIDLNIYTISLIHSWDVITTKGSFIFPTDKVILWNKINENEYKYFVNEMFGYKSKIVKVGIPQFDIYKEKIKSSNLDEIKEFLGIPTFKRIIVYTTSVKSLFPEEKEIIKKLISDFESNSFCNCFLYIRMHPQEGFDYYNDIPLVGSNYKINIPETSSTEIEDLVSFSEHTLLKLFNDLFVADLVVSMASSISLDATALNKPVINIAFDTVDGKQKHYATSVRRYYTTDHFSKIINYGDMNVCHSYSELFEIISGFRKLSNSKSLKYNYIYDFGNSVENIVKELSNE